MSEDQKPRAAEHDEPQDEVEAHRVGANEEPKQEDDDEVEAHSHMRKGKPKHA